MFEAVEFDPSMSPMSISMLYVIGILLRDFGIRNMGYLKFHMKSDDALTLLAYGLSGSDFSSVQLEQS